MNKEYWMKWFKAAGIRALKTFAQTIIAVCGMSEVLSDVDWGVCLSTAVLAAILSLLTSLAGIPEVEKEAIEAQATIDEEEGGEDE